MKKALLCLMLCYGGAMSLSCNLCYAQTTPRRSADAYDFVPRETVIFEDDFSQDAVGTFPSKWRRFSERGLQGSRSPEHVYVKEEDNGHVLVSRDIIMDIEPDVTDRLILPDSFTLEFDFMLGLDTFSNCVDIAFGNTEESHKTGSDWFWICGNGDVQYDNPLYYPDLHIQKAKYPGKFALYAWHHLAITSRSTAYKLYIDQYCLMTIPAHEKIIPNFTLHCMPPGKIKNFRLATGKRMNSFSKLNTEKKFVTSNINFDVNKAIVRQESIGYLLQLAQFLQANLAMKLEIDGHTDSDGNPETNMKLSEERANAVKDLLVQNGIDKSRLSAKGFGATKPILPNNTPGSKAKNRRVEFVKQ